MSEQQLNDDKENMSIILRYTGPAVDSGSMEVHEVAGNMVAFS
jgi:hypothetical protein